MRAIFVSLAYFLSLAAITSCLWGCTSSKEVTYDSGGVSQTVTEGKNISSNNFPLPIYPKATAAGQVSAKSDSTDNNAFMLLATTDSVDNVRDFYLDKLKEDNWKIDENHVLASLVNISAKKNDTEASVMISGDGKQTNISLSINKEIEGVPEEGKTFSPDKLNPPTD